MKGKQRQQSVDLKSEWVPDQNDEPVGWPAAGHRVSSAYHCLLWNYYKEEPNEEHLLSSVSVKACSNGVICN